MFKRLKPNKQGKTQKFLMAGQHDGKKSRLRAFARTRAKNMSIIKVVLLFLYSLMKKKKIQNDLINM